MEKKYRIHVEGNAGERELLLVLKQELSVRYGGPQDAADFHWWLGDASSNALHLRTGTLNALVRLSRYVTTGPFDLSITTFEALDHEQSHSALLNNILRILGATVWTLAPNAHLYSLWVDYNTRGINLYTGDEFEPYQFGEFTDCAAAQAACRRLVDEDLTDRARPGVTLDQLIQDYHDAGVNPKIIHPDGTPCGCQFAAADYARLRARELAGDLWNDADARHSQSHTERVTTELSTLEIAARIFALGEPGTFGGITAEGSLNCVIRFEDGASTLFRREANSSEVRLSVNLPGGSRTRYRAAEHRCDRTAALLDLQPATERAWQTLNEAAVEKAALVDLGNHGLTSLPPELWLQFPEITQLNLAGNWLREIPPEIERLSKLESLNVADNCLTELPSQLSSLRNLRSLNVSGNLLSTFPDFLCKLSNLAGLALSSNRLAIVPGEIWKLFRLESLRLDRNQLKSIPVQVGQLTRLRKLTLDHNRLAALPLEIGSLTNLKDFEERAKRHLPSPDELCGLTAEANPLGGDPPTGSGRQLRDHLASQLNARLATIPWCTVYSEQAEFAIQMPARPTQSQALQYKALFNRCLYSVAARQVPRNPEDQRTLEDSLDQLEAQYADQWARSSIRKKWKLGNLPGIEHAIDTPAGILRLLTFLSRTHLYQVQVEGPPECVFAGESDAYFNSFRVAPIGWKD